MNFTIVDIMKETSNYKKKFIWKTLSKTDAGIKSNQRGFLIEKTAAEKLFKKDLDWSKDRPERFVNIIWQNDKTKQTESRLVYYPSKNEYRLTCISKGVDLKSKDVTGALFILIKMNINKYKGYILNDEDDIENALSNFPSENKFKKELSSKEAKTYIEGLDEWPTTKKISKMARIFCSLDEKEIKKNPGISLIKWLELEFELFKKIEKKLYKEKYEGHIDTFEDMIDAFQSILQTRKSRSGKSVENHLSEVFKSFNLKFEEQKKTGGSTPDFIFPNITEYEKNTKDRNKIVFLASKRTCKERWRQVITEAKKIKIKHIFTLQEEFSDSLLEDMKENNVILIVPNFENTREKLKEHSKKNYEESKVIEIKRFIDYVANTQL